MYSALSVRGRMPKRESGKTCPIFTEPVAGVYRDAASPGINRT